MIQLSSSSSSSSSSQCRRQRFLLRLMLLLLPLLLCLVPCFGTKATAEELELTGTVTTDPLDGKETTTMMNRSNNNNHNDKRASSSSSSHSHSSQSDHRKLQNSGFSLFVRFCMPNGNSFREERMSFLRAIFFRLFNTVEEKNEGACDEDKCFQLCDGDRDCRCDCAEQNSFPASQECGPRDTRSPTTPIIPTPTPSFAPTTSHPTTGTPTTIAPTTLAPIAPGACIPDCSTLPELSKCCDGVCIANDQCCLSTDGKQCPSGSCSENAPNFGCCVEDQCADNTCCDGEGGFTCCDNACKLEQCCGNSNPCCGNTDPCCGSLDPCCKSDDNSILTTSAPACLPPAAGNGDPHFTTYDGLSFDCQAEGEFVLTKSLQSKFEIQGRFTRPETLKASITQGLAIRSSFSSSLVQVSVTEQTGVLWWVNGNVIPNMAATGYTSNGVAIGPIPPSSSSSGGGGESTDQQFFLYNVDAAMNITVLQSPFGPYLDYKINLNAKFRNQTMVGLLGSPDDNPANDWMDSSGTTLPIPSTREDLTSTPANDYCTLHWCVRDETQAMFIHANSEEFATIRSGCDKQYGERPAIVDTKLQDLCGDDLDCLLDGFLFGIETARASVAAQTRYLDPETSRFRVTPNNLVQGVDTIINVTLDLRNQDREAIDTEGIDSFGLFATDETGDVLIATLQRLNVNTAGEGGEPGPPVFIGENIDISARSATLKAGTSQGLSARKRDSTTSAISSDVTITQRKAFRVMNKFGEGKCFETKFELQTAVSQYLDNNSRDSPVARKYGHPIDVWCVKNIKDFSGLFRNAVSFNEALNSWDVSRSTSMNSMFSGARDFNSPIQSWDVGKVRDMSFMFSEATNFNMDISGWNVENVTAMERMFYFAKSFNQDLSKWELKSVNNLQSMFSFTDSYQQNLCNWTRWLVGREVDTLYMFREATKCPTTSTQIPDQNLISSGYQVNLCHLCTMALDSNEKLRRAVDDSLGSDTFATDLYGPIESWNVTLVSDFTSTFENKVTFNKSLIAWDVTRATNMQKMFAGAKAFKGGVSSWQVDRVTDMNYMFFEASAFQDDLFSWNVGQVRKMSFMFFRASSFNKNISAWDVSRVTSMERMFAYAESFNQSLCEWGNKLGSDTTVTNLEGSMFQFSACPNASTPDLGLVPPSPLCYACYL